MILKLKWVDAEVDNLIRCWDLERGKRWIVIIHWADWRGDKEWDWEIRVWGTYRISEFRSMDVGPAGEDDFTLDRVEDVKEGLGFI